MIKYFAQILFWFLVVILMVGLFDMIQYYNRYQHPDNEQENMLIRPSFDHAYTMKEAPMKPEL